MKIKVARPGSEALRGRHFVWRRCLPCSPALALLARLDEELVRRRPGRVIVVGELAMELYSGGAYRAGDVDFINTTLQGPRRRAGSSRSSPRRPAGAECPEPAGARRPLSGPGRLPLHRAREGAPRVRLLGLAGRGRLVVLRELAARDGVPSRLDELAAAARLEAYLPAVLLVRTRHPRVPRLEAGAALGVLHIELAYPSGILRRR